MEYNTYNQVDNSELRRLQLSILDIVKIFSRICETHGLRFFMIGGTMLGAIRHKGFIPWDDDADMGMPRSDYERFLTIVSDELPEGYSFLNYKSATGYKRYFSRIVNTNIRIYNASNTKEIVENAWIDIFPFDGLPQNFIKRQFHFWRLSALRLMYHMSCFDEMVNLNRPGRPFYQQVIIRFLGHVKIGRNWDSYRLLDKIEEGLCRYDYDTSTYVMNFFGAYVEKEVIRKDLLGDLKQYPFEDMYLYGAEKVDPYLTRFYGDWAQLPMDTQKDKHSIRRIEYLQDEGRMREG